MWNFLQGWQPKQNDRVEWTLVTSWGFHCIPLPEDGTVLLKGEKQLIRTTLFNEMNSNFILIFFSPPVRGANAVGDLFFFNISYEEKKKNYEVPRLRFGHAINCRSLHRCINIEPH